MKKRKKRMNYQQKRLSSDTAYQLNNSIKSMTEISQKQLEANKENAKKGGVKTEEGKAISKYNALKHGILKEVVSGYEEGVYEDIKDRLEDQFQPVGILEKMLVDRIGVYYLKLYRVAKAENEYMQATLDPRKVTIRDRMDFGLDTTETIVENEGYIPKVTAHEVEKLSSVYLRYEIAIENRLFKALHELQRLQASRNGEKVPPPLAVDVGVDNEGENGFVS